MNYVQMFEDSFEYVKGAIWGKWVKWLLLIVCVIIFPLFFGYLTEIFRGKRSPPELENWGKLFIDGLKFLAVAIVYTIPVVVILVISVGLTILTRPDAIFGGAILAVFLSLIVAFLVLIIASIALVRFSRFGIREAFNFSAIFEQIRRIGWGNYVVGLLLVYVALGIVNFMISRIPFVGGLLNFILNPAYGIFFARFITLLYDSAEQTLQITVK